MRAIAGDRIAGWTPTRGIPGDEVVALILSVAIAQATPYTPFAAGAQRALAKIQAALPARRVGELQRFMQRVLVGNPAPRSASRDAHRIHQHLVSRFEEAFTTNRMLGFGYTDCESATTKRQVEPHGLLLRAPLWYIIAWDPEKDAARLFRADRISKPRVLEATFAPRPHDLVTGICPDGWPASTDRTSTRVIGRTIAWHLGHSGLQASGVAPTGNDRPWALSRGEVAPGPHTMSGRSEAKAGTFGDRNRLWP